jgi:hypothetical protein
LRLLGCLPRGLLLPVVFMQCLTAMLLLLLFKLLVQLLMLLVQVLLVLQPLA